MKLNNMIVVNHEPGDPFRETDTDWDAIDALTTRNSRLRRSADPDAQPIPAGTDEELAKLGLHRLVNVKKLRERLGLTQEEFAATYRIPVGTLRDWEQRRKNPDATARAYLMVIAKNPQAVAEWLSHGIAAICSPISYPRRKSLAFCTSTSRLTSEIALVSGICLGQASTQFCANPHS